MTTKFTGIGASDGIAIAKALILKYEKLPIKNTAIRKSEQEIEKVHAAIKQSIAQIDIIIEKNKSRLKADELEVFAAHKQIANDPFVVKLIIEDIKTNKTNAGFSINKIFQSQAKVMSSMEDEYMQARAADIKDVCNRILHNYYNVPLIDLGAINQEVILIAKDFTPSETSQLQKKYIKAFLTDIGGRTSHSAIMARSLEIPAVVGLKTITQNVKNGDYVIVDADKGTVLVNPTDAEKKEYQKLLETQLVEKKQLQSLIGQVSKSKDEHKVILAANIGNVSDMEGVLKNDAEEIGLFRSEFLYMGQSSWPNEEIQYQSYRQVLEKMQNRRVIIRTLDIGGDKNLEYFKFPEELNPFLGYRAIRLCLDKKEIFRVQIRALLRASKYGKLAIMFPMIAVVDEFLEAKKFVKEVEKELISEGKQVGSVEIGMMIEIPAAALNIEAFCLHADFFSIGSNDLIQYTMAADRLSEKVTYLYRPLSPAVLKLIFQTIQGAHKHNKPVGVCGEIASVPQVVPVLLGMGLDEFSMSASSILKTRKLISELSFSELQKHIPQILACESAQKVLEYLEKHHWV